MHSKYTNVLEDIDFEQEKLVTENGTANYLIEIKEATATTFVATATSVVDFDGDGKFNVWEINEKKELKEKVKD
jgi:type IV pilus assembly protein PilE